MDGGGMGKRDQEKGEDPVGMRRAIESTYT